MVFWKFILIHIFAVPNILNMAVWKIDVPDMRNKSRISKMDKKRDLLDVLTKTKLWDFKFTKSMVSIIDFCSVSFNPQSRVKYDAPHPESGDFIFENGRG